VPFMLTSLSPLLFLSSDIAYTKDANDQLQRGLTLAKRVYNADDPVQARSKLTVEEQNLVDSATQPGALEVHYQLIGSAKGPGVKNLVAYINGAKNPGAKNPGAENLVAAYSGCWELNQVGGRKSRLGNTLYTYWQTTRVCAKNGRVTSVAVTDADGETSTPGWRVAHAPTTKSKNVRWEGRGLARYYFVLGAGGWDVGNPTDCIQQRLNGNGVHHLSSPSCNLDARLP